MADETEHLDAQTQFGLVGYFAVQVERNGQMVKRAALQIEGDAFYQLQNGHVRSFKVGAEAANKFTPFSGERMQTLRERTDFNALAMDGILRQVQGVLDQEVQRAAEEAAAEAAKLADAGLISLRRPGGNMGD